MRNNNVKNKKKIQSFISRNDYNTIPYIETIVHDKNNDDKNSSQKGEETKEKQIKKEKKEKEETKSEEEAAKEKSESKKTLSGCRIAIIASVGALVVLGIIALLLYFIFKGKKDDDNEEKGNDNNKKNEATIITKKDIITEKDEIMKVFQKPTFKVSSKVGTLNQLLCKSTKEYKSITNGIESSYSLFTKAKYDIFTLNEASSGEDKDFYSTKYSTAITVNSYCITFSSNSGENDCELETYLNLNIRDTRNLRRNDEINEEELLKSAILPICLIEHTNTNLILSISCPETLSSNLRKDMILAFRTVKPESIHEVNENKEYTGTKVEEKDNKLYIESFSKDCDDYNEEDYMENPNQNIACMLTRNIITDKEGNLISSKRVSTTETTIDDLNKNSYELTFLFEDVTRQNEELINQQNYKINLNIILNKIKSFMNKEIYLKDGGFQEIVNDFLSGEANKKTAKANVRNLHSIESMEGNNKKEPGVQEENFFNKTAMGVKVDLNIKNDVGLGESKTSEVSSNYGNQNFSHSLSLIPYETNLNETLDKFISLMKSGNKLAMNLFSQLNDKILDIRDIIDSNITYLNENLTFKDLDSIFDGTNPDNQLEKLPFTFIVASENLNKDLNDLNKDINYVVNDMKNKLKNYISEYLRTSHNLLFKIFNNLTDVTNLLSSEKNKIVEISTYYLNHTSTSYVEIIEKAKNILDNYYKEEKLLIEPLINTIVAEFSKKTSESIKDIQKTLRDTMDQIDNGKTTINLASNDDIRNAIRYLYNSEINANEIITKVEQKFKETMNLQSNGYFESQTEINNYKNTYERISQKAINISYSLDNNNFIDTTFDNIMTYFRDQFIVILNDMDRLKNERFSLRENVLSDSLFGEDYMREINDFFSNEKKNIHNLIKEENEGYLNSINSMFDSFKNNNGENLNNYMNDIGDILSVNNLVKLTDSFNASLYSALNNINAIINYNYQKATEYLNNVNNSSSTHMTQAFKNKYNDFINSFYQIKNFIKSNLKNNLANKYKTVINQIRILLQSIKSNEVLKKYYNELPFAEEHLLNIDNLYIRFEKYISDDIFNNYYLQIIKDFIQSTNKNLSEYENNLNNIYNSISRLPLSTSTQFDYYQKETYCYRYCSFGLFIFCFIHSTACEDKYVGYNVTGTNNHLELKTISLDSYTNEFDEKYNQIYNNFKNIISLYNNHLEELNHQIELKYQEILNKDRNTNYLNALDEKVKTIINEKLGTNLLVASYNYYKNLLSSTLPNTLNDILDEIKSIYDNVYEKINLNKNKFKSTIYEFYGLSSLYSQIIISNITYNYGDSINQKCKNEFNYTIKYYYNLITSKVNKTYSYLINTIPINAKPFDELSNLRISQINNSFNELLNQINKSKNEMLQNKNQTKILKVNNNNFFITNDYINDNIDDIEEELTNKIIQFENIAYEVDNDEPSELIAAKYYLENALNGKQIKEIYENVDRISFIDLQYNVYEQLFEDILKPDTDEMINNIERFIINSGEIINNKFKFEKAKYVELLNNQIYKQLYYPEDLKTEINNLYSWGLNTLTENDKDLIYGYVDEILNEIKIHILSETFLLDDKLESYSNNYEIINNTIKNIKDSIYNKFNSTITSVINGFYNNVTQKFYADFIEFYLKDYQNRTSQEKFTNKQFLNTSINLSEVINTNLKRCIDQYKNTAKEEINLMYNKYYEQLDNIFKFSDLKKRIDNEIASVYDSQLFLKLKEKATYNENDLGIENYNLNETTIKIINQIIEDKIANTKIIVEKMKGNGYDVIEKKVPDFSTLKRFVFNKIDDSFKSFIIMNDESKEINNTITNNIIDNFKTMIKNFVPSFGVDFFERILNYNEIEKINGLFYNLKYSLLNTIFYYITLCNWYTDEIFLPEDIKVKILTLNNLDSIVDSKKDYIISLLNQKLDSFFENTKNLAISKYYDYIITDPNIKLKFNNNIVSIINGTILGYRNKLEKEYINQINNLKEPFIKEYTKIINKETNDMQKYIEKRREDVRVDLNEIFTLNSDAVLFQIDNKLNDTAKAIEEYKTHFSTFELPEEVRSYLLDFGVNILYPKYKYIEELIFQNSINEIYKKLDLLSTEFKDEYSIERFDSMINNAKSNFTDYVGVINETLKNYGAIDGEYRKNLETEQSNYRRIRRLEEMNEEKILYDVQLDTTFQELQKTSKSIIDFFDSLNLFNDFNQKLENYINEIDVQTKKVEELLNECKDKNIYFEEMMRKLSELNSHSLDYYDKVNISYYKMRELIDNEIKQIDTLINKCINVTYNVMEEKFIAINESFNKIEVKQNKEEEELNMKDTISRYQEGYYNIKAKFNNYFVDSEFFFDIYFEDGDIRKPRLKGKVINKIQPKKCQIYIYVSEETTKTGIIIKPYFNNISAYSEINYDANLNAAKIKTNFNFQEYIIETQDYQEKKETCESNLDGVNFKIPGKEKEQITEGNKNETVASNNLVIEEVYNY